MVRFLNNLFSDAKWFIQSLYEKRDLIAELAKRELKEKYTGSYLGPAWLFLEPISFICILWFVFSIGLRGRGGGEEIPFIVFLATGIVCWGYFSENFNSNTGLVKQYSFLLTKTDVALSIIPIVNLISSLVAHGVLIFFVVIIAAVNKVYPTFYLIQIFYYTGAMMVLLLGLGWLTSALNVFVNDVAKIVKVLVQFGFWLTPIIWNYKMIGPQYLPVFKLNPVFYIIQGYRDCIFNKIPFWEKPLWSLYYWGFTVFILLLGAIVFKRLRPHFAAVI